MVTNSTTTNPVVDEGSEARLSSGHDETELLARFADWDMQLNAHWDQWRIESKECYEFVASRQWTAEEKADAEAGGKILVDFNRISPLLDAVCGAEIQGRNQVQYFPREVGDSAVDEILTQGSQWIDQACDAGDEESEMFRDTLTCGVGWVEHRIDIDLDTKVVKERVDPLEIWPDASSKKANFADMRYLKRQKRMSKDAAYEWAEEMGWPLDAFEKDGGLNPKKPVIVDPRVRYTGENETYDQDEVVINEWQWWEREHVRLVAHPESGEILELSEDEFEEVFAENPALQSVKHSKKRFYRAYEGGGLVLEVEEIKAGDFLYKACTGKRDRNKGTWFGIVRPMIEPQRWGNKLLTEILHIMRSNANGGLMMEEGAADDIRDFEETWADPAANTYFANGALSNPNGPRVVPKPAIQYPTGLDRLMEVSNNAIQEVSGINKEILGLADRQQPGILEHQRKQAAYGILSPFFAGLRRYRKESGRLMLTLMRLYIPPDTLVRVVGESGSPEMVPLALKSDTAKYDVVVDEAPSSPNQKAQTFAVIQQMLPLLANADLPGEFWGIVAKYSPLPASMAQKIAEMLVKQEQQQQQAEQAAQQAMQPKQDAMFQAELADKQASANDKNAKAEKTLSEIGKEEPQELPEDNSVEDFARLQESDAKVGLDRARTAQILNQIINPPETKTNGD